MTSALPAPHLLSAILRSDLASFIARAFAELNPGVGYLPNWHIRAIAHALEQVRTGLCTRLIINMPPRSLKSLSASIAFPAFVHGHDPTASIIAVSYAQDLATKLQNDYRAILEAGWYQRLFPATRISDRKNAESEVMLTRRGSRLATSIGGTLTGRGGDIIIIDDPLKPAEAMSEPRRQAVNDWFSSTLISRLNDKRRGAIIIVSQRVHANDLVGHVLERGGDDWTILDLAAIAPAPAAIPIGSGRIHRRAAGALLHPEREPADVLDRIRRDIGTEAFAAQYLQTPVPPGGNMIARAWIQRYTEPPARTSGSSILQSWDTASKAGAANDWSVCTTWLVQNGCYFLLDLYRGRVEFPALRSKAITLADSWRPERILVEDTGVGTGLIHELRAAGHSPLAVTPQLSKQARMSIESAKFEAGRVFFPRSAPWLPDLEAELFAFPGSRHDDQVDSIAQALAYTPRTITIRIAAWD